MSQGRRLDRVLTFVAVLLGIGAVAVLIAHFGFDAWSRLYSLGWIALALVVVVNGWRAFRRVRRQEGRPPS